MIRKMDHVGIYVKDVERSIRFYTEVLGMKVMEQAALQDGTKVAFLAFPGEEHVQVELVGRDPSGMPMEGRVNHLALTVDDIEAVIETLKNNGIEISDEWPKAILDGRKIAFFYGPEGEKLQLAQPARKGD